MATIKDVARVAGVSVGTVSHYLTGSARVGGARAQRIQESIAALGYKVDLGARGLRAGTTRTVGLVVPNISNPFFGEVARSIEHALAEKEFQMFLCDSGDEPDREEAYLANLASRRVDGMLVIYADQNADPARLRSASGIPLVFVDRGVPGRPSVSIDNRMGGRLAAQHLLELGHRRIGIMAGDSDVHNVAARVDGFIDELREHGAVPARELLLEGRQNLTFGTRVEQLLALAEPPTAIFATNDIVAVGAWQKLLSLGVRVPDDISLVGFDDIELARSLIPPLTTVVQDKRALGRRATERLLALITSGDAGTANPHDAEVEEEFIEPRLVKRESTAASPRSGARPRMVG